MSRRSKGAGWSEHSRRYPTKELEKTLRRQIAEAAEAQAAVFNARHREQVRCKR